MFNNLFKIKQPSSEEKKPNALQVATVPPCPPPPVDHNVINYQSQMERKRRFFSAIGGALGSLGSKIGLGKIASHIGLGKVASKIGVGKILSKVGIGNIASKLGIGKIASKFGLGKITSNIGNILSTAQTVLPFISKPKPPTQQHYHSGHHYMQPVHGHGRVQTLVIRAVKLALRRERLAFRSILIRLLRMNQSILGNAIRQLGGQSGVSIGSNHGSRRCKYVVRRGRYFGVYRGFSGRPRRFR